MRLILGPLLDFVKRLPFATATRKVLLHWGILLSFGRRGIFLVEKTLKIISKFGTLFKKGKVFSQFRNISRGGISAWLEFCINSMEAKVDLFQRMALHFRKSFQCKNGIW
ncbi:hypothetical protein CEXT_455131 [Caerostris extrusa]|uniref:Uncharacterized protein n=1 Tax=Caerostris extrusa TaxID=172846 RepID=A0AAV4QDF5_CAEEX|nr:hypothetical protein CEXT_455131 [Caerostris extrusa]